MLAMMPRLLHGGKYSLKLKGAVPDRNIERLLRRSHIPVPPGDMRRLDIVVTRLNVHRGLLLFCDVTIVSPLSGDGEPRGGTSNHDGTLLRDAQHENDATYHEVVQSGLGSLLCLGSEVFGRWSQQCIKLVPALAREKARGLHPRIRRGHALSLQHRWWGLLGMSLQRVVAHIVLHADAGADLITTQLEPAPFLGDLPA